MLFTDIPSSSNDQSGNTFSSFELHNSERSAFIIEETVSSSNIQAQGHGSLAFINGLAFVLGLQIGSGIFFAPSQVSSHVSSPGVNILVWLFAGILVLSGAASFIELGIAMPKNGGMQEECLGACYGEFAGFLFSWIWVAMPKPCVMAMIAMIFAEILDTAFVPQRVASVWEAKGIAVAGVLGITLVNCLVIITGARVAYVFLLEKLLAILSIAIIGIVVGILRSGHDSLGTEWFGKDPDPQCQALGVGATAGELVTAIYGALFCYGGWETVC